MPRKRVCHVIFDHRTFDGRVFFKEAVSLARAGYEVIVLVPSLGKGWFGRRHTEQVLDEEPFMRDGVRFVGYPYRRWITRKFGLRHAVFQRDLLASLRRLQPDLCHFHEDGVTMEVAAQLKDVLPGTKLVFDFHEFFPHRLRLTEKKLRTLPEYFATENRVLAAADGLVTVSDFMSQYYRTLTNKPVVTVMNSQSARVFPAGEGPVPQDGTFWVVHEGSMLFDRGLQLLVHAAPLIRSPQVQFLLIGDMPPAELAWFSAQTAKDGTSDRFHVTGMLPYQQVPEWLRRGHVGLCLNQSPNALMGTPNKFFNYLRFGVPVLAVEHPVMGPIIRGAQCGETLPRPAVATDLAEAIDRLATDSALQARLSAAAARLFDEELNWERMERRLLGLYEELLPDHAS